MLTDPLRLLLAHRGVFPQNENPKTIMPILFQIFYNNVEHRFCFSACQILCCPSSVFCSSWCMWLEWEAVERVCHVTALFVGSHAHWSNNCRSSCLQRHKSCSGQSTVKHYTWPLCLSAGPLFRSSKIYFFLGHNITRSDFPSWAVDDAWGIRCDQRKQTPINKFMNRMLNYCKLRENEATGASKRRCWVW